VPELTIDNQIINAIRQISQAVETYSHFLWQEYGLTAPQLGTLRELEARGKGTPTEVAQWMSVSAPTAAGILKRLKQRNLIDRSPDPEDGRSFVVQITDEGRELAKKAPSLLRDKFRKKLVDLEAWERTYLLSALQRVAFLMNAEDLEEAPFLYTEPVDSEREPKTKKSTPHSPRAADRGASSIN
jgi:DNA-binding MarR family transcriptional regulator